MWRPDLADEGLPAFDSNHDDEPMPRPASGRAGKKRAHSPDGSDEGDGEEDM